MEIIIIADPASVIPQHVGLENDAGSRSGVSSLEVYLFRIIHCHRPLDICKAIRQNALSATITDHRYCELKSTDVSFATGQIAYLFILYFISVIKKIKNEWITAPAIYVNIKNRQKCKVIASTLVEFHTKTYIKCN